MIEVLITLSILAIVELAIFSGFQFSLRAMKYARAKTNAVGLANEKMENIRNLPYDDLATQHGAIYPPGDILDNEDVNFEGTWFSVNTIIAYVDDPYDGDALGTVEGKPVDLYPFDYKRAEVSVRERGKTSVLAKISSLVSAKAAETASNSGIIKLCVIDSIGQAMDGASVVIQNDDVNPVVDISATVGSDGCIMVPNLPPDGNNNYHLEATKNGFSRAMTYPRTAQNPNATYPDVNVYVQQVTNQTLIIDRLSTMNINLVDTGGNPVGNRLVHIAGAKEIYFNPSAPKYEADVAVDGQGRATLKNMEFDDYSFEVSGWGIASVSPYQPVALAAGANMDVFITLTNSSTIAKIFSAAPASQKSGLIATVSAEGEDFDNNMVIRLVGEAVTVNASGVDVSGGGRSADFTLDLTGVAPGFYDLIFVNPGGQTVQKNGFEVKP